MTLGVAVAILALPASWSFSLQAGGHGPILLIAGDHDKNWFLRSSRAKKDIRHCAIDDRPNDYHDWLLEVLTGLYCCATESETKSFFRTGSQFSMQSQRTPSGGSSVIQRWSISAAEQSPRQGDRAPWTCALQRASLIPPDAFEIQEMKSREAAT